MGRADWVVSKSETAPVILEGGWGNSVEMEPSDCRARTERYIPESSSVTYITSSVDAVQSPELAWMMTRRLPHTVSSFRFAAESAMREEISEERSCLGR